MSRGSEEDDGKDKEDKQEGQMERMKARSWRRNVWRKRGSRRRRDRRRKGGKGINLGSCQSRVMRRARERRD